LTDEEKYAENKQYNGNEPFLYANKKIYQRKKADALRKEKEAKGEIVEQTKKVRVSSRAKTTANV
jgi:hypothetical protein